MRQRRVQRWLLPLAAAPAILFGLQPPGMDARSPAFRADDPLPREPETQDASRVEAWDIDLFIDLAVNLFGTPGDNAAGVRAHNVNTIDEVPDSSWFTNRILARPVSIPEATRTPRDGPAPAPGLWTVIAAKETGNAPGFTIEDADGEKWFVSFDARGYPQAATGAILVANKIFWTLGYWQVDNVLTSVRPGQMLLGDTATVRPMSGKPRRMRQSDLAAIFRRAHPSHDGSYRAVAARALPGRPLGGFRYHGTRPDDPNDLVPHEHRRELRALKVFGAWTNLVDLKAGNTLDVLLHEGGRGRVRHYLQDVGSTFGTGARAPREHFEGWESLYDKNVTWKRMVSLGFYLKKWQTIPYRESAAIGRFEGEVFDPRAWTPRVPTAALRHAQPDDLFWAARRVMAFSDQMICALVQTAQYTDPRDAQHLAITLMQRRDKIGAAYLSAVLPLVNFSLSASGELVFENAAASAAATLGISPPHGRYHLAWALFDNGTGAVTPLGETTVSGERATAPGLLPRHDGRFVRVRLTVVEPAVETWTPIDVFFRPTSGGWTLVGLDRHLPAGGVDTLANRS